MIVKTFLTVWQVKEGRMLDLEQAYDGLSWSVLHLLSTVLCRTISAMCSCIPWTGLGPNPTSVGATS